MAGAEMECSTCGTINDKQALFCKNCRLMLGASTPSNGQQRVLPVILSKDAEDTIAATEELSTLQNTQQTKSVILPKDAGGATGVPAPSNSPEGMASLSRRPGGAGPGGTQPGNNAPEPPPIAPTSPISPFFVTIRHRLTGLWSNHRSRENTIIVIISVVVVMMTMNIYPPMPGKKTQPTPESTSTLPPLPEGLGVVRLPDGQYIGVNDGSFPAFDVYSNHADDAAKAEAAQALKNNDPQTAITALKKGLGQDASDAEAQIYLANIRAIVFGNYITLVVAVDFVQPFPDTASQRTLRGAYTLQNEFNSEKHAVRLRLLIANTASKPGYVESVAQQIVRIAKKAPVVGVLGWLTSHSSLNALPILAAAQIPMVSPSASSDELTNSSPYFFRVVPPNNQQAQVAADFAREQLNAKNAVVFFDAHDTDSSTIANDFEADFTNKKGTILSENYAYNGTSAVGFQFSTNETDQQKFSQLIQQAIKQYSKVDIFYFAGVTSHDAALFQDGLSSIAKDDASLSVIGGNGSYVAEHTSYNRWYFAAYAYPDEWHIVTNDHVSTPFFNEYAANFDPRNIHHGDYNFDRPNADAILAYDAATALIKAAQMASPLNTPQDVARITPQNIAAMLPRVTFQGLSGYIAFNADGNPQNKAIVVLYVADAGYIKMKCIGSGTFYPGVDQSQNACHA